MIEQFKSENEKLNQRIAALEAIEKEFLASKNSEEKKRNPNGDIKKKCTTAGKNIRKMIFIQVEAQ